MDENDSMGPERFPDDQRREGERIADSQTEEGFDQGSAPSDEGLKALIELRLKLVKTDISEWPSIPEIAVGTMEALSKIGLDDYDRQTLERIEELERMSEELEDNRLIMDFVPLAPLYNRLSRNSEISAKLGIYPIPPTLTGEKAVLVLGDPEAEDWDKRIPSVENASGTVEDLMMTQAMALLTLTASLDGGGYLDRRSFTDERDISGCDTTGTRGVTPTKSIIKLVKRAARDLNPEDKNPETCRALLDEEANSINSRVPKFVLSLLRYRRPEFDEMPFDDQLKLLSKVDEQLSAMFTVVRRLDETLDYGTAEERWEKIKVETPRLPDDPS